MQAISSQLSSSASTLFGLESTSSLGLSLFGRVSKVPVVQLGGRTTSRSLIRVIIIFSYKYTPHRLWNTLSQLHAKMSVPITTSVQVRLIAVPTVFSLLAAVAVSLRFLARKVANRRPEASDWVMVASCVSLRSC